MKYFALILVCLTIQGCKKDKSVQINGTPDFTVTGLAMVGETMSFLSNQTLDNRTSWDFGDNTTSKSSQSNHIYSVAGTYTVTMTINIDTVISVKKAVTVFNDPHYTSLMGGVRNWHQTRTSYNPNTGTWATGTLADVSFAVNYINPLTVSIGSNTLNYISSDGDSVLYFESSNAVVVYFDHSSLSFNRIRNSMVYVNVEHVSAAGGDASTTEWTP